MNDKTIGATIRHFRKCEKITLEQLAFQLGKSKSTISKYERGLLSVDIETLKKICIILNIDINLLLKDKISTSFNPHKKAFLFGDKAFMYYYDGREAKVITSVVVPVLTQNDFCEVLLYNNLKDVYDIESCSCLFKGTAHFQDYTCYMTLKSCVNDSEFLNISILHPMKSGVHALGIISGISTSSSFGLVTTKVIFSETLQTDLHQLKKLLKYTREDLSSISKLNMLILSNK